MKIQYYVYLHFVTENCDICFSRVFMDSAEHAWRSLWTSRQSLISDSLACAWFNSYHSCWYEQLGNLLSPNLIASCVTLPWAGSCSWAIREPQDIKGPQSSCTAPYQSVALTHIFIYFPWWLLMGKRSVQFLILAWWKSVSPVWIELHQYVLAHAVFCSLECIFLYINF